MVTFFTSVMLFSLLLFLKTIFSFISLFGKNMRDICVSVPVTDVSGILWKKASLPCDITPNEKNDVVFMVLWFKNAETEPIYRQVSNIHICMTQVFYL